MAVLLQISPVFVHTYYETPPGVQTMLATQPDIDTIAITRTFEGIEAAPIASSHR